MQRPRPITIHALPYAGVICMFTTPDSLFIKRLRLFGNQFLLYADVFKDGFPANLTQRVFLMSIL